jgi:hypothetical protein
LPKLITVELINKCLDNLKLGKACGPDDLGPEHLLYAHPLLVVCLKLLVISIFTHGYVPDKFGFGVSVDKSGSVNDVNTYRAITLIPVISKVLEGVILILCDAMAAPGFLAPRGIYHICRSPWVEPQS